jgi:Ca2+-transporting ATPase
MDGHKPYYRSGAEEVLRQLRSAKNGLAAAEAADRRRIVGENLFEIASPRPVWQQFLGQILHPAVLLLLFGMILALVAGDGNLAGALAVVAAVNAALGLATARNTGNNTAPLSNLLPAKATVLRGGNLKRIAAFKLVPGDVISLKAGSPVPADVRVISANGLYVDESVFNGSTQPVYKFERALEADTSLTRRHNMVYAGTTIAQGSGQAVVTATGTSTELGRLIHLCSGGSLRATTSHNEQILSRNLMLAALAAGGLTALICAAAGIERTTLLLLVISAMVAALPFGLPLVRSLLLVHATRQLARAGVHLKKLASLEALGATTNVIAHAASLTSGELTARELLIGRATYRVTGHGYGVNGVITDEHHTPLSGMALKDLHLLFQAGTLASTATVHASENESLVWQASGAPTEGALLALARKAGIDPDTIRARLAEAMHYSFGPDHRLQTSIRSVDGQLYVFMQGSVESVLAVSSELWDHGHVRRFTAKDHSFYAEKQQALADDSLHTVACAYRVLPKSFDPRKHSRQEVEQNMIFLGLIGLEEPLREQALEALDTCKRLRLPVTLLADETPAAAAAFARRVGLANDKIVSAADFDAASESELKAILKRGGVIFNQLDAAAKVRLVEAARTNRTAVAMTGVSASDSPALQRASVSIALGQSLTVGDLALPHGSFGAIAAVIARGRQSLQQLHQATSTAHADRAALLATIGLSVLGAAIFAVPTALTAMQILLIVLLLQLFPQIALGYESGSEPPAKAAPSASPRRFLRANWPELTGFGLLAAALTYGNYLLFFARHHVSPVDLGPLVAPHRQATTLAVATLAFCLLVHLLMRHKPVRLTSDVRQIEWRPRVAYLISLFLLLNVVYNPGLHHFLGTGSLTLKDWLTALIAAGLYTLAHLFYYHTRRTSRKALLNKHSPATIHRHVTSQLHKSRKTP